MTIDNNDFELDLKDLNEYTFFELNNLLQKSFKLVTEISGNNMIAKWESSKTILIIMYDKYGNFVSKLDEKWKS